MLNRSLFRLMLVLYPRGFRRRFGPEMLVELEMSRARCRTPREVGAFWLRSVWDLAKTVPRARWHALTNPPAPSNPSNQRERQVLDELMKDVQLAARGLIRRPGAAMISILALSLGIGLTTGMFSIVNGVILKGLPVEEPNELVALNRVNPSQGPNRLLTRIHDFADMQERQSTFEGLAAYEVTSFNLSTGEGPPEFVSAANVTVNTFDLLRTPPVLGRDFVPGDDVVGAAPVALIAYRFWQDRFNGEPDVLGRTVRLDGQPTEIIGIIPAGIEFPFNQQVWKPLPPADLNTERGSGPS